jgi:kynurenine formamidase
VSDRLLDVVDRGVRIVDLGRQMFAGMPQSPNHPPFTHVLPRRHGDSFRPGGDSAANDLIITGTHVGTHIDAFAHVSHEGLLHGGARADEATDRGRFLSHGVHTIAPMVRRAVLLDVPAALGVAVCAGGYEITPADLDATVRAQGIEVREGDVVLIRSGWGVHFDEGTEAYLGKQTGVPGVSEAGARWLVDQHVHAAGADTIAFECLAPGAGHGSLPAHRVLLVDGGVYIIEALELDELARRGVYEFTLVLVPMNILGATGSPVRPLAVLADE